MAEPVTRSGGRRRIAHPTVEQRRAQGREARVRSPRSGHAGWVPATDRPDPVALLEAQNRTREPDLIPVRHGRMAVSPLTFYRGAAVIMASDLRTTPTAGLTTQLCGDAHLSNFGGYASPERTLVFDVNDFDETLPGPFEFDLKRLAASFAITARNNGFAKGDALGPAMTSVRAYREAMATFASMRTLDVWYAHLSEDQVMATARGGVRTKADQRALARAERNVQKAHTHDSLQALSKLGEVVDGQYRIVSQPPVIVPLRELRSRYGIDAERPGPIVREQFRNYRATLEDDRRHLLERFEFVDFARKVVGVGSVGTRAFIILLQGRDAHDPLFLQVKEATRSVLEAYLPRSRYRHHGERVVMGQRLMQAASDIFLGWTIGVDARRHFYWRQLRDMKVSAIVEGMAPTPLAVYAQLCGRTLAKAHARAGDPVAIAAYLGSGDAFDRAIVDFAKRYADQNEKDYEEFLSAIKSGRLEAKVGV
jgi:uncharacterized protein (DUF2252 family)